MILNFKKIQPLQLKMYVHNFVQNRCQTTVEKIWNQAAWICIFGLQLKRESPSKDLNFSSVSIGLVSFTEIEQSNEVKNKT